MQVFYSIAAILRIASLVFSGVLKPVRRIKPSPLGPNPAPGVVTTLPCSSRRSKNAQESRPSGVFAQT